MLVCIADVCKSNIDSSFLRTRIPDSGVGLNSDLWRPFATEYCETVWTSWGAWTRAGPVRQQEILRVFSTEHGQLERGDFTSR
jgi:hypothetical protein